MKNYIVGKSDQVVSPLPETDVTPPPTITFGMVYMHDFINDVDYTR